MNNDARIDAYACKRNRSRTGCGGALGFHGLSRCSVTAAHSDAPTLIANQLAACSAHPRSVETTLLLPRGQPRRIGAPTPRRITQCVASAHGSQPRSWKTNSSTHAWCMPMAFIETTVCVASNSPMPPQMAAMERQRGAGRRRASEGMEKWYALVCARRRPLQRIDVHLQPARSTAATILRIIAA